MAVIKQWQKYGHDMFTVITNINQVGNLFSYRTEMNWNQLLIFLTKWMSVLWSVQNLWAETCKSICGGGSLPLSVTVVLFYSGPVLSSFSTTQPQQPTTPSLNTSTQPSLSSSPWSVYWRSWHLVSWWVLNTRRHRLKKNNLNRVSLYDLKILSILSQMTCLFHRTTFEILGIFLISSLFLAASLR